MDKRKFITLLPIVFLLGDQFGTIRTRFRMRDLVKRVHKESETLVLAWSVTYGAVDKIVAGEDPEAVQAWFDEQKVFIDTVRESM